MATQRKTKRKLPAKRKRSTLAKSKVITLGSRSAGVDAAGVKTTFTLDAYVYICPDNPPVEKPTIFSLVLKKSPESKTTSMSLRGTPPTFKIDRILGALGVKDEELKKAVAGDLTIDKITYESITDVNTPANNYTNLDFGISFAPSDEFVLNKFPKVLLVEKVAVTFNKVEGTKPK